MKESANKPQPKTAPRWVVERKARGWSGAKLARVADLNASTINLAERGRLLLYPSQLAKIASAFGFEGDPAELLEEVQT